MKQAKKGNRWYFGMKAHVGTDTRRGLVHRVIVTNASVHDSRVMDDLLSGEETVVYGDKAYADEVKMNKYRERGIEWCISRKGSRSRPLSDKDREWNHVHNRIRAKGEHAFHVVKCLWNYRKVRYKGLAKDAAQMFSLFALANLYLVRKELVMTRA
jgi:IS5 family transposase